MKGNPIVWTRSALQFGTEKSHFVGLTLFPSKKRGKKKRKNVLKIDSISVYEKQTINITLAESPDQGYLTIFLNIASAA